MVITSMISRFLYREKRKMYEQDVKGHLFSGSIFPSQIPRQIVVSTELTFVL